MLFLTNSSDIVVYVILLFSIVPILVLSMIVLIKIILKRAKAQPRKGSEANELIDIFGGNDNIVNVSKELTRVSIEVKSLEAVDMDKLKDLNVGTLIVGNTIKCSSEAIAKAFENYEK